MELDGIALGRLEASIGARAAAPGRPKYLRLSEAFEALIREGHWRPGARLPAEADLVARLPVSLGTVQRAMGRLAERGLVVRQRRNGTFIADPTEQVPEVHVYRFRDAATGEILMPFVRVLAVAVDRTDGPWRRFLGVDGIVRIDRLVRVAEDPPAFSSVFLAATHGAHLLKTPLAELHGMSVHRHVVERFGLPTLRMEHRVHARPLADDAADYLAVPRGTTGLVWDVSDHTLGDAPVMFQRFQMPPGHRPMELSEAVGRPLDPPGRPKRAAPKARPEERTP